jgi:LL-diaminopimelate aminotransferase
MQREFDVQLDPTSKINHCIGSKTALSMIPACFINPGDVTLMTVPGYPVAGTHTKYYGGEIHELPLLAENEFLPDLHSIPVDILQRAKLLVINYPNSPTGKLANAAFYAEVVEFAKQHQIVVVQDAAHIMLTFAGKPTSFLETPGARDVGVEIHSMSKGFDMIGWRIGWVCGNPLLVRAFADVKDNCDSGQFIAIQKAAVAALDDETIAPRVREKYRRRMTNLVTALSTCGFQCSMPGGSYFLYTPAPTGVKMDPLLPMPKKRVNI